MFGSVFLKNTYISRLVFLMLVFYSGVSVGDGVYDFNELGTGVCSDVAVLVEDGEGKEAIDKYISDLNSASVLRYIAGDDSWFGDVYSQLESRRFLVGVSYADTMKNLKGQIITDDQKWYVRTYRKKIEAEALGYSKKTPKKGDLNRKYYADAFKCQVKSFLAGEDSVALDNVRAIVRSSVDIARQAVVGYFDVKIDSCKVVGSNVTNKSYAEPKAWPGSRFVVIDARFKNIDVEGRLPVEGSLIVKHNGRELRYDSTETIMLEGYGIYFKSVNPLISMPTRIVYRIPDEIGGEIFWEPGRNDQRKRLWCNFVSPEN